MNRIRARKNMAQAGIRTRVTSLANRNATITPQRQASKFSMLAVLGFTNDVWFIS